MAKVAIYPGHVGKDSGAVDGTDAATGDQLHTIEAVISWAIADKVAGLLGDMGIEHTVGIGPFDDRIRDTRDCDLGVSIHADWLPVRRVHGYHVIYNGDARDRELAHAIDAAMSVVSDRARQVHIRRDLYILRQTAFPCVLVECGFLSNREEEAALMLRSRQHRSAWAIVSGIMRYVYNGKE